MRLRTVGLPIRFRTNSTRSARFKRANSSAALRNGHGEQDDARREWEERTAGEMSVETVPVIAFAYGSGAIARTRLDAFSRIGRMIVASFEETIDDQSMNGLKAHQE